MRRARRAHVSLTGEHRSFVSKAEAQPCGEVQSGKVAGILWLPRCLMKIIPTTSVLELAAPERTDGDTT